MTYADAAPLYRQAGWLGVLPLPARAKSNPPGGHTGVTGVDPTDEQVATWVAENPGGNLALRMPDNVIGIDLDLYKDPTARDRLHALIGCVLPPTIASTSKLDGSGIYLYRVPPLAADKRFLDAPVEAVEVIQRGHRYAVVWPSVHPDGPGYFWWDTSSGERIDGAPDIDDDRIAFLPFRAFDALVTGRNMYDEREAVSVTLTTGPTSPKVQAKLEEGIAACVGSPGGRHDRTRDIVAALVRLGDRGEPGVDFALGELRRIFVDAVTPDRPNPAHAAHEFDDLVKGALRIVATTESTVIDLPDLTVLGAATAPTSTNLPTVASDPDMVIGSSWRRSPIADVVHGIQTGAVNLATPTLGVRPDGLGLFYPGRVNGLYGEPGKGKTWIALAVVAEQLDAGEAVAWIDLEEPAHGIVGRLLDLGVDPQAIVERFAHFAPEEPIRNAHGFAETLAELAPSLAVIDSTGEALALEGAGPNNDDEVARWFQTWPRWIANHTGAGVIVIDHVVKDETTRGLWPGGSQRKKAAVNGSAFMAATIHDLGRGFEGRLKLTTSKDRQGHHRVGARAGQFVLDARNPARIAWRIEDPENAPEGDDWKPTTLMERVSTWLEEQTGPASRKAIEDAITGKRDSIRQALKHLVEDGYVDVAPGDRFGRLVSVRPYPEPAPEVTEIGPTW